MISVCSWLRRPSSRRTQSSKFDTLADRCTIVDDENAVDDKPSNDIAVVQSLEFEQTNSKCVTLVKVSNSRRVFIRFGSSESRLARSLTISITKCRICSLKMRLDGALSRKDESTPVTITLIPPTIENVWHAIENRLSHDEFRQAGIAELAERAVDRGLVDGETLDVVVDARQDVIAEAVKDRIGGDGVSEVDGSSVHEIASQTVEFFTDADA